MKIYTQRGRSFEPRELKRDYGELPMSIIADLAELCFAGQTTFVESDRQTCVNIGRQQVWLHINRFLGLTQEEIENIYVGRSVVLKPVEDDE